MTTTQENSNSSCETVIVQTSSPPTPPLSSTSINLNSATKQHVNGAQPTRSSKQMKISRSNQQRHQLRHHHNNSNNHQIHLSNSSNSNYDVSTNGENHANQSKPQVVESEQEIEQIQLSNLGQVKQFLISYFNNNNGNSNGTNKCKSVPLTPVKSCLVTKAPPPSPPPPTTTNLDDRNHQPPNIHQQDPSKSTPTKKHRYLSWLYPHINQSKGAASAAIINTPLTSSLQNNSNDINNNNNNNNNNVSQNFTKTKNDRSDSSSNNKTTLNAKNNVKIIVETVSKEVQTEGDNNHHLNNNNCNTKHKNKSNEIAHSIADDGREEEISSTDQILSECPMSTKKFREHGRNLIDYISDYLDTIGKRRVTPLNIEPGYLRALLDVDAPKQGEKFEVIMKDFENHIMCGITHWQHPRFHAYFPAGNAYPSILADMLSDAIGCVGFSWAASPACTELEIIMLDWMGKMIGLPEEFLCLSGAESKGGGVIQGSASECVLVNLLAARHVAIDKLRKKYPNTPDGVLLSKLIGYCSKEAHSCVEKAAMIGFIKMRALETDAKYSLRGEVLARAIKQDKANGLEPFLVSATLGTTSCCSFDNLEEVGKVCQDHDIWLHVDAAYAGSALICPEFKYLMKGIELATSFNMNPNKWMLINFDCSLMWVKDRFQLTRAFVVDPLYLQHSFSDKAIDYRHWGIPLSRRFRALKLWFVIRNYGVEGLQRYIRNHVKLAKRFEELIKADSRFEIINQVVLGLVCFRLVGSNALNQRLLSNINASGKLHMVPASLNGRYIIRFCVCAQDACEKDICHAYQCISEFASELFESIRAGRERIRAISQQNTIDVSDISLHTQQSASADLRSNQPTTIGTAALQQIQATNQNNNSNNKFNTATNTLIGAPAALSPASTSASSQTIENSNNQSQDSAEELAARAKSNLSAIGNTTASRATANCSPTSTRTSPMMMNTHTRTNQIVRGASNKLLKQQQLVAASANNVKNDASRSTGSELDETDLEQDIILDDPSLLDDMEDDEDFGALLLSDEESKGANEAEEAVDEVFKLEKRNRMSLRYKRGFFVRVVSDPKMYRVSISGDIGDSTGSIGSASGS